MLIITIKQGKEKSLLARDPLIYVSAVERVDGKPGERRQWGATAVVQSSSGQFLARASHSPESQVRARVWSFDQAEAIDHAFMKRRVKAAIARSTSENAKKASQPLRLVDGDRDGLPGLEVDWFTAAPGYLICRFHAAGVDAWKIPIVQALMAETGCPNVYEQSDPLTRRAEELPEVSGALAGDEPPADLLAGAAAARPARKPGLKPASKPGSAPAPKPGANTAKRPVIARPARLVPAGSMPTAAPKKPR